MVPFTAPSPTYADALRILGHGGSPVLKLAEAAAGAGAEIAGLPGMGAVSALLVSYGSGAVTEVRERLTGLARIDRTRRIAAAHAAIVVGAYFEALDELLHETHADFDLDDLDLPKRDRIRLAAPSGPEGGGPTTRTGSSPAGAPGPASRSGPFTATGGDLVRDLLESRIPLPSAHRAFEDNRRTVISAYRELTGRVGALAALRIAAASGARIGALDDAVTDRAAELYTGRYRLLMAEVPEFAAWAGLVEHDATRSAVRDESAALRARIDGLGTGLAGLSALLERMTVGTTGADGTAMDERRAELAARHRAALRGPLLPGADLPEGFSLPTVDEAYLDPRGRVSRVYPGDRPSTDDWWAGFPVRDDLSAVLVGILTSPDAGEVPIVVLGHPGAGKSKLAEVLAARLPGEDFLAVRVELRTVPADAPVQDQIEYALRAATGASVSWPELARSAAGALPVVILDGFDELVQATGVNRSDYIEQVRDFQRRESELGRAVAVIVTSRTVVADRARFPEGTLAVRLEPLSDGQIERLLDVWTRRNRAALAERGLAPVGLGTLLAHRDLAEQPLLLIMLLLFDADGNALQHHDTALGRAGLYERLLTVFARREVLKHEPNLSAAQAEEAVDDELHRLEVVALAMFARHRQTVGAAELDRDLSALAGAAGSRRREDGADAGLHGRISDADRLLGRFFFVHEARARQGAAASASSPTAAATFSSSAPVSVPSSVPPSASGTRSAYEFLHATFGEYLVARLVVGALRELAALRAQLATLRRSAPKPDDGLLYAVTSFAAISGRAAIVDFVSDLLTRAFTARPDDRAACVALLAELLRDAPYPHRHRSFSEYRPRSLPTGTREAVYTANLVLLTVLAHAGPVDVGALLATGPNTPSAERAWGRLAGRWRDMAAAEATGMVDALRARHLRGGGIGDRADRIVLQAEDGSPLNLGECTGFALPGPPASLTDPYGVTVPNTGETAQLLRAVALFGNRDAARQLPLLAPFLTHVSPDLATWWGAQDQDDAVPLAYSHLHDVLALRLAPPLSDWPSRVRVYTRLLDFSLVLDPLNLTVLRQAAEDLAVLAPDSTEWMELGSMVQVFLERADAGRPVRPPLDPVVVAQTLDLLDARLPKADATARLRARLRARPHT